MLYGCGTWSLTLKEECWLRLIENGILRQIFGPKRGSKEWRMRKWKDDIRMDLKEIGINARKWVD